MKEVRIRRSAVLKQLDDEELVQGYRDGLHGRPVPEDASFSYRHGHRNGMIDSGRREGDAISRELARDCCQEMFREIFGKKR